MQPDPLIPPSAWLLAQASIVASHKTLRRCASTLYIPEQNEATRKRDILLTIGPGRDGGLSRHTGFLSAFPQEQSLTRAFESWEATVYQLPSLLRQGRVHTAICCLPSLLPELAMLEERYLSRAAIVISSLLHSYVYELRTLGQDTSTTQLPENLIAAWDYVSSQLGRPQTVRMIADDMLNNIRRLPGLPTRLSTEYFGVQEERMSVGVQVQMEEVFAPALEMMTNVQKSILARDDTGLMKDLAGVAERIIACAATFCSVPFRHGPEGFDPVFWGKTYPEIGRPLRSGGLANSGVNSPLFHALDAFLGTIDPKDDLHEQQINRRVLLPHPVRRFIEALGDPRYSIRSYVEKNSSPAVTASFNAVLQIYVWFLERHRIRAISGITIAIASGRPRTAGGAQQDRWPIPLDEMLNRQMQKAMEKRVRGRPWTLKAEVVAVALAGRKTTSLTLVFPCPLPVEAGDRIQIWPRNKVGISEIAQVERIVGKNLEPILDPVLHELLTSRDLQPLRKVQVRPGISAQHLLEELPVLAPRHYTVSEVEKDIHGLAQRVVLTISHCEGLSAKFLRRSVPGQPLTTRVIPEPRFRLPADDKTPLLLIAQGAGVGPFLGFLRTRSLRSDGSAGNMILVLSAREPEDVPYRKELTILTQQLPLTVHLTLSKREGCTIQCGQESRWSKVMKVQERLANLVADIKTICKENVGHTYVCGSVGFGISVRSTLLEMNLIDEHRYHEDCFGGHAAVSTPREVTIAELARHNKPGSLWMAIAGTVYDLTSFGESHPGGLKTLIESAGTVADRRFHLIHSGDSSQGILSQIARFAIGPLRYGNLSRSRVQMLSQIVQSQNVLCNNTSRAPGREMPFFIYCDSLLVSRRDLERIAVDVLNENNAALSGLSDKLDKLFADLKTAAWQFLSKALDTPLPDREQRVLSTYSTHWGEFDGLFEGLKELCCVSSSTDNDATNDNDAHFVAQFDTMLRVGIVKMIDSVQIRIRALSCEVKDR
jgi:ferredoxin-NADP reductase